MWGYSIFGCYLYTSHMYDMFSTICQPYKRKYDYKPESNFPEMTHASCFYSIRKAKKADLILDLKYKNHLQTF